MSSQYDWEKMVSFILRELFFSQRELAEHCKVTQQSISYYKQNIRKPGPYSKKRLLEILVQSGINPSIFLIDPSSTVEFPSDKKLKELINIYTEIPLASKIALLEFARFKLNIKNK